MELAALAAYRTERLHFDDPALREVSTTYLITLEGSARRAAYMRQLALHRPTRRVVVVHNPGYKDGRKPGVTCAAHDLWHANQFVARRAWAEDFVLVLEDDVLFTPHFRRHAPSIDRFLAAHRGAELAYSLGIQPFFAYPHGDQLRVLLGGATQAVIYSNPTLRYFPFLTLPRLPRLGSGASSLVPHDLLVYAAFPTWAPREVCAYQPCDPTANMAEWDQFGHLRALHALCGFDGRRVYRLFHAVGAVGGVGAVITLVVVAIALVVGRVVSRRPPA